MLDRGQTLQIIILSLLFLAGCDAEKIDSDKESQWAPFCNQEIFYKPYIRIREGRNGRVIDDLGPGLHDLRNLENIYLCANGLVFLYFKIHEKEHGEIYDDAVMQYASHFCGFYNGRPGPGVGERENTLVAVLLLGHAEDYRQVAMQMFTAPLFNPATNKSENFTSLAIINTDGECILERGREKARIRIKGNPSEDVQKKNYEATEEHHITLCRLDGHLLVQDDDSKVPLDPEWANKEEALKVLTVSQDSDLRLTGCYKYPLLDQQQVDIIAKRKNETLDEDFFIDTKQSEMNPGDGEDLKFWTKERIAKYGNPTDPVGDEASLMTEVVAKNTSFQTEQGKDRNSRNPEAIKSTEEALKMAVLNLKLAPYYKKYQKFFGAVKTFTNEAKKGWADVSNFVEEDSVKMSRQNYITEQQEISNLRHQQIQHPYNSKLQVKLEEAFQHSDEYKGNLWEKTLKLGPMITNAEVMSARRKTYLAEANRTMEKIQKLILSFEKSRKPPGADYKEMPELFTDLVVSVKNPVGGDAPACITFERKQDQCKFVKPSAKRSCQLAKIKIGGAGDWPGGDGDKWRDEVLELFNNIFKKGCTRLKGDFAYGINSILKAYLIKQPEAEEDKDIVSGAPLIDRTRQNFLSNYKIKTPDDLFPPLPGKTDIPWDEIIEKLQKCEKEVKPLEFSVESSSSTPIRVSHNGKLVPKVVEQADLEFSFNWVLDSNFRIFATVLGLCLKEFERGEAKKFYDGYTQGFLEPIRPIWLSNRDNPTFEIIFGQYYVTGKGDLWTRECQEASYIRSGKPDLRPVRNVYVNSYTEPNFIARGPGQGSRGPFYGA